MSNSDIISIYKIEFHSAIYIGSTVNIKRRLNRHKCNLRNNSKLKLYEHMRENDYKEEDITIYVLEQCNIKNRYEREGYYIRLLGNLNKKIMGRSQKEYMKEWYEKNKEEILTKKKKYSVNNKDVKKEWYEKNKEKVSLKAKERYEKNKEKVLIRHKSRYEEKKEEILTKHKKYYEKNKEWLALKGKEWYEKNKEKVALKAKERYEKNKEKRKN